MIHIRITGPVTLGPSWKAIQQTIASLLDEPGHLVRVARRDHGANYRATVGTYDLDFVPDRGDLVPVVLTVNAPEEA